jgi:hypothetical protein
VSSSIAPPADDTTPIWVRSPRFTSSASHCPSGDHTGYEIASRSSVTRRRGPPSSRCVQTFIAPLESMA